MKKIEKALEMMNEFDYGSYILNDKLYVKVWNGDLSDSTSFQVSEEEIDKWAAEYNTKRREVLLREAKHDLQLIHDTIHYSGNEEIYKAEWHEDVTLGELLVNVTKYVDEMNKLESNGE
jgi:hypothetical protein